MATTHVDIHAGQRLRARRVLKGLSQTKLANGVGLTFQQIQKYERGANRISASRLHQFSKILDVPVAYFFEDIPGEEPTGSPTALLPEKTLKLVRFFQALDDPAKQDAVYQIVKALSSHEPRPRKKRIAK